MQDINDDLREKVGKGQNKGHYATPAAEAAFLSKLKKGKIENPKNIGKLSIEEYVHALHTNGPSAKIKCGCKIDEILDFSATPGFGSYKRYFHPDSVAHPAKASALLLDFLIEEYTKPGETVLDPMAGTYSTCVVAARKGRNAIGVELEDRFFKWGKETAKRAMKGADGQMTVLKGDSRDLSKILHSKLGIALSSPPYSNVMNFDSRGGVISPYMGGLIHKLSGVPSKAFAHDYQVLTAAMEKARSKVPAKYSNDPKNIGNLQHGEIDNITTSAPFVSTKQDRWPIERRKGTSFQTHKKLAGNHETGGAGSDTFLSNNPNNIDNLQHGEISDIISSVPFGKGGGEGGGKGIGSHGYVGEKGPDFSLHRRHDRKYGVDPKNISNLDVVAFSPAYGDSISRKQGGKTQIRHAGKTTISAGEYSKDPNNIGNLTVAFSPPYEGTILAGGGRKERNGRLAVQGYNNAAYVSGTARNTVLGHYDGGVPKKEQIGLMHKETYLSEMLKIYEECYKVLKPSGKLILIIKDFLRHKRVVLLHEDTIRLCKLSGFCLKKHLLSKVPIKSFWRQLYEKQHPEVDTSALQWEHVLIFEK